MKQIISVPNAPKGGPYSHAVRSGNLLYTSGQIPIDAATGKLVAGDVTTEVRQVFANLKVVLNAAGIDLENVIKTTAFLTDLDDFAAVNAVYAEMFPVNPPARSCFQVSALPLGARVEIEAIAAFDSAAG